MREILSDLVAEQQSLDQFLQRIHERDWRLPTPAKGWTIHDTVSHLASAEAYSAGVLLGSDAAPAPGTDLDTLIATGVAEGRGKRYQEVIEWWRNGRADVVDALSRMDAHDRVGFLGSDGQTVSAMGFASIRMMETWAHGLDIKTAMEGRLPVPDDEEEVETDSPRIRHIAWLAQRMLPLAFERAGETYPQGGVRVELMGPKYARWVYGPDEAEDVIRGMAGEFCRVAVQRLDVTDTGLKAMGDGAEIALRVVRAY